MTTMEILDTYIYPNINRLELLRELNPKPRGDHLELDCPYCKESGVAYLYDNGTVIICNRENNCGQEISIWDYIQKTKRLSDQDTLYELARSANYTLPERYFSDTGETSGAILKLDQTKRSIIERAQEFFVEMLFEPQGEKIREYLHSRGYSKEDIFFMELGYNPGYKEAAKSIRNRMSERDAVDHIFEYLPYRDTHQITIPFRDAKGNLKSIWGRVTPGIDDKNKYLPYTKDASKACPINMHRARKHDEIIIVEGFLDPLIAASRGMDNVIGICGPTITNDQLATIVACKPKRIFLALDHDRAGVEGTLGSIKKLNKTHLEVFVVTLPQDENGKRYKDPDELIGKAEQGLQQFKTAVACADSCGNWLANNISQKHNLNTDLGRRTASDEIFEWHNILNDPIEKKAIRESATKAFNIPEEKWQDIVDEAHQAQYEKEMLAYGESLNQLISKGQYEEARNLSIPANPKIKDNFCIKFLDEMDTDFLLDKAPDMPRLINIREGQTISPFIARGIVCSVVALGGTGKTHYLTQLSLSVATGHEFLHKYPVQEKGNVVIIYGENDEDDIHRLTNKTVKGLYGDFSGNIPESEKTAIKEAKSRIAVMSVHGKDASFMDKDGNATKFYNKLFDDLKKTANTLEGGISLIAFDPASRFLGSEAEINSAMATKFIAMLEAMTQQIKGKPTIIFAHHMNKTSISKESDQGSARGSSALTDGPRLQINLEPNKQDKTRMTILQKMAKSNHTKIIADEILIKDSFGCLSVDKAHKKPQTSESEEPEPPANENGKPEDTVIRTGKDKNKRN